MQAAKPHGVRWPGGQMRKLFGTIGCILVSTLLLAMPASGDTAASRHYQNFRVAVYITVDSTIRLADPQTREREFDRVSSQLHIDKVYLEVYRNRPVRGSQSKRPERCCSVA